MARKQLDPGIRVIVGALILMDVLDNLTWQLVAMALLALTVARIVPVAISMIGTGLRAPTLLHLGWFGPRGLATIVFAAVVVANADLAGIDTITAAEAHHGRAQRATARDDLVPWL